ncbi:Lytic transglycosylase catalytic [Gluconacetobacter diazotrophicus PA1 5]|uniref:Lytic transglycosylase domain-containing protein n=1 Tax=Gluconacetobacter diazotrophicus TaxID=33996 RepID=A0A7W4I7M0_GLUDI|nr:lytic transglycosylase domain-containing protein [Gluconacetobacter diazotrophicus]ACI51068.1 Lytic transglycosylase catalytic [Gluconacetobacter diazotrophicus PA1 5]MBB2157763.1 lytic transglycosylase domain-containing protein [Gluconacetobacter diazotrophicus]TWB00951.1 soluble lytic murein transglycosylase-like protein [Gluconacetobacter diazotrophicus]
MRGTTHTPPQIAVRAFLAGAALLAGATFTPLRVQTANARNTDGHPSGPGERNEETALAMPRIAPPGGGAVGLAQPLSPDVVAQVRRIFSLQRAGAFDDAIRETAQLRDDTLLGDILADRYLNPAYHPAPGQLRLWLRTFSTLADAPAIHTLLAGLSPRGASLPPLPAQMALAAGTGAAAMRPPEEDDPAGRAFARNPLLDRTVRDRAEQGVKGARSALHLIKITPGIGDLYAAQLRAEVAMTLFSAGETALALRTGQDAFIQSGGRIGLAGYVAGLAAWRRGRPDIAEPLFEGASRAELTAAGIRAGAAFWAARAHRNTGDLAAYHPWLHRAAAAPHTFYGLLAAQLLGLRPAKGQHAADTSLPGEPLSGEPAAPSAMPAEDRTMLHAGAPVMGEIDVDAVAAKPAGRRAFALLQVGETARAEAALRRLWPEVQGDAALCRSIQLVADAAGLTGLSAQLSSLLASQGAPQPAVPSRFPTPRLAPSHGFRVDPALVYALTRLESNFDSGAISGSGAHGLMQIMPTTASFVTGRTRRFEAAPALLHNAATNLDIGQLYVLYLAHLSEQHAGGRHPSGGDLVRLLASYNAGPGAISRQEALNDCGDDPLLFIESLPSAETRDYVHRALTYLWIYADQMGLPTPSLETLARNEWPAFAAEQDLAGRHFHTIH